jgi:hypothetical protein
MFASKNEERMIKSLIQRNKENPTEELTFLLENGSEVSGEVNSFYETDNGLEMEEEGYLEFYACAVKMKDGTFKEFGGNNLPKAILLEDGEILWSKKLTI